MLLEYSKAKKFFRCPEMGGFLREEDKGIFVSEDDSSVQYREKKGQPVLINFEKSILSKEDFLKREAESPIQRNNYLGLFSFFKRLVSPPKKQTQKNIDLLLSLLEKDDGIKYVLVVGGGSIGQGMKPIYEHPDLKVISFDIYASDHTQFIADAHDIPLPDNLFDCVIVQAVLEHVVDPEQVVSEIYRLTKQEGLVYSETPFLQQVHEGAFDFTRFTDSGHRYLFREFSLITSGNSAGPGTQLLWTIDYFSRSLFRSRVIGKVAKLCFFWVQYFDKIIPSKYAVDSASGVFFLGRKQKNNAFEPEDIIQYYRGAQ